MKSHFSILLLLAVFSLSIFAEQAETRKQIQLKKVQSTSSGKPGTRSVQPLCISAYLNFNNTLLEINFLDEHTSAQILIKTTLTDETIYSDTYSIPTNILIPLPTMEEGEYSLEIISDNESFIGNFSIE